MKKTMKPGDMFNAFKAKTKKKSEFAPVESAVAKKTKMTQKEDDASDKKHGIKEGSKRDMAQDKRNGIKDKKVKKVEKKCKVCGK